MITVIFDKFSRIKASYKDQHVGTGIGLYIVRNYIEKMSGSIDVTSTVNKGTTFHCEIPFKIAPQSSLDNEKTNTPHKQELYLPGTHIPIHSPDKLLETKFKKDVIKYVLDSKYCSKNPCLDLSTVFDNKGFFLKEYYNSVASNKSLLKQWMESGIFVDNFHLNDRGNKVIAQEIMKWINSLQ